jgi:hypothetical protein
MAVAILFETEMSVVQYEECMLRLALAGQGEPAGRLCHACYLVGEGVRIFDVWDGEESFDRFADALLPVLGGLGVAPGVPAVYQLHSFIPGAQAG